jgi:hypothetical protein
LKLAEAPLVTVIGKAFWDIVHAPKDGAELKDHFFTAQRPLP